MTPSGSTQALAGILRAGGSTLKESGSRAATQVWTSLAGVPMLQGTKGGRSIGRRFESMEAGTAGTLALAPAGRRAFRGWRGC